MKSKTIICLLLLAGTTAFAQTYNVAIPDIEVPNTVAQVTVPINVAENLTNDGITAYQGVITWNDAVIQYSHQEHTGTLSEAWGTSGWFENPSAGYLSFGQYVSSTPLEGGPGTIVNLIFNVVGDPGTNTTIAFSNFYLNAYQATTTDGSVTITASDIDVSPTALDIYQNGGDQLLGSTNPSSLRASSQMSSGEHGRGLVIPENVKEYWQTHTPQFAYSVQNLQASIDWSTNDSPVKNQGVAARVGPLRL